MYDFSSLIAKVDALKAKIEQSSITPLYLGSLLNDFLLAMHGIDMTDMPASVSAALEKATDALEQASAAMTAAQAAQTAADTAGGKADTANTTAANNTALIKQLQGNLQIVDWILKSISAGTAAPDSVKAKMRRVNAWSSEEDEREIVLLPAATEEAAGAMTAQHVKDLKLAKGFMATKGKAYGLAPLDADKHVPEKHLPDKVFDVLTFGGIDDTLYDLETGSAAATPEDANASLVYSSVRDHFVLKVRETVSGGGISTNPPKYYGWFNGAERYGTPDQDGIVPYENKLYLNLREGGVYYWYDLMLWKTDLDVSIRVDSLENKIGEANGIAPLDANKLIPEEHIPATFRNVAHFAEVIDSKPDAVSPGTAPGAVGDDEVDVVFCEATKRFLFRHTPADGLGRFAYFYKIDGWQKLGESADENGVIPSAGKLYVNDKQGDALYWHGNALRPLRPAIKESDDIHTTIANPGTAGQSVQLNMTEAARKSLFCDLFTAAVGTAGYAKFTNGVWDCKLNGLTLSYNEAVEIYKYGITSLEYGNSKFANYQGRTTLPIRRTQTYDAHGHTGEMFYNAAKLEVVGMDLCTLTRRTFYGCSALRTILGVVQVIYDVPADTFKGCTSLVDIDLRVAHPNPVNLGDSPLLSLDSVTGMVNRSAAETSFTVHADVYAKLTGDTTNAAAAALSADELAAWQAVLSTAAGKNIAFASA